MHLIVRYIWFLWLVHQPPRVSSSGRLELKMVKFENEEGDGSNGNCCDGRSIFCGSDCDHFFNVCLDRGTGDDSMNHCPFGATQTGTVQNMDSFVFGNNIGGTPNPIIFNFTEWLPEGMKLKIRVWDEDTSNDHDHVDDLSGILRGDPDRSAYSAREQTVVLSTRTRLTMLVKKYCNTNYYGSRCATFCFPTDHPILGHYECSLTTGEKLCYTGWTGPSCQTNINECSSFPCMNDGTCQDRIGYYLCQCAWPYEGTHCDVNIDQCLSNPCANSGRCRSSPSGFRCDCTSGFTGQRCNIDVDECASQPCKNDGTCTDRTAGYECACAQGYSGANCQRDPCSNVVCQNGGHCEISGSTGLCQCPIGYRGELCADTMDPCDSDPCQEGCTCLSDVMSYNCSCTDVYRKTQNDSNMEACASTPCENGANCTIIDGRVSCRCPEEFEGALCQFNISLCNSAPCENNGTCVGDHVSYTCLCSSGFTGSACTSPTPDCTNVLCENGGTCVTQTNKVTCLCSPGYGGNLCERDLDECESSPCQGLTSTCVDEINGYHCICPETATGKKCEQPITIDICTVASACLNNATCIPEHGNPLAHFCACQDGYTGKHCELIIDNCSDITCGHNGFCTSFIGGYTCACGSGWTGVNCTSEIQTNDCTDSTCLNGGTCQLGPIGFICLCSSGWTGSSCQNPQGCPCSDHGNCTETPSGPACVCHDGWGGHQCELEICSNHSCENMGTCRMVNGKIKCKCLPGYTGDKCENDINECRSRPCQNGGMCVDVANTYHCSCTNDFTGIYCETATKTKAFSSFMFNGELDKDQIERLKDTLLELVAAQRHVPQEKLLMKWHFSECIGENGETVNVFEFQITDEDYNIIPWYTINDIVHKRGKPGEKDILPQNLYNGSRCVGTARAGRLGASKSQDGYRFWKPWQIAVCGAAVAVCVAVLVVGLAVHFRKKRRMWTLDDAGVTNPLYEDNHVISENESRPIVNKDTESGFPRRSTNEPLPPIP